MIDAMPRKLPLYVVRQTTRHGEVVFYFRRGKGQRVRLRGIPGSKEFLRAYESALRGQPIEDAPEPTQARSLRWLVERYMASAKWAGFSPATRKQQGLIFKRSLETSANVDFRKIKPRDIRAALEARKATPAMANTFLKSMNGLFSWAVGNIEDFSINPCAGVQKLRNRTNGFPLWTPEDIANFCARWQIGTRQRLAMELLAHSGLRRSDVVIAGRQHLTGNIFSMRTKKTNIVITVEFPQSLMDVIDATPTGDLHFIVNDKGTAYTVESFGNWFRDACRDAGVMKSAHGLRKLAATLSANSGGTAHQLMAQFGWTNSQQAEVYTRGADRIRLGVQSSRLVAEQLETMKAPNDRGKRTK